MKKIIPFLISLILFSSFIGTSGNTTPKQYYSDTTVKKIVDTAATETTPLLSYQDIQLVIEKVLGDIPLKYAEPVRNSLIALIQQRAQEYAAKKKLKQ